MGVYCMMHQIFHEGLAQYRTNSGPSISTHGCLVPIPANRNAKKHLSRAGLQYLSTVPLPLLVNGVGVLLIPYAYGVGGLYASRCRYLGTIG
jgi:hypothetical protein